jgi:hypothetical protein
MVRVDDGFGHSTPVDGAPRLQCFFVRGVRRLQSSLKARFSPGPSPVTIGNRLISL